MNLHDSIQCKKSNRNTFFAAFIILVSVTLPVEAMIHPDRRMFKEVVPLQLDERCGLEYKLALELNARGETKRAQQTLLDILKMNARYHLARMELVELFLKEGNEKEAKQLLDEGLKIAKNYPGFLKLYASIEEQKGNVEEALRILSDMPNENKKDLEYVAWLGLLYHRSGHYELAKRQYLDLIKVEPNIASWWLGLSLAVESEGNKKEALKLYQKTYSIGGLDPSVLQYVSDKINALSSKSRKTFGK